MQDRQEEQWGNDLNDDRWEGQADPNGRNTVQTPQPVNYGSQRRGSRGILLPAILAAVSVTCLVVVLALTGAFDWITDGGDTSSSDDPPVQQQSMSVVVTSDEEDEAEKEEEPAKQEEESSTKKEAEPAAEQAAPATTTTQEAAPVQQESTPEVYVSRDNATILTANTEAGVNFRQYPRYASDVVGGTTGYERIYWSGSYGEGYGSDGIIHQWYYVESESGSRGYVRSDLVHEVTASDSSSTSSDYIILVANTSAGVNFRQYPRYASDVVGGTYGYEYMYWDGSYGEGYGSDGIIHQWYYVFKANGECGYVRSDLVHQI